MFEGIAYSKNIVKLVEDIYGKNSNVYLAMVNGEKVSFLVKSDIKKKGFNKGVYRNFKAKKELLRLLLEEESTFSKGLGV